MTTQDDKLTKAEAQFKRAAERTAKLEAKVERERKRARELKIKRLLGGLSAFSRAVKALDDAHEGVCDAREALADGGAPADPLVLREIFAAMNEAHVAIVTKAKAAANVQAELACRAAADSGLPPVADPRD